MVQVTLTEDQRWEGQFYAAGAQDVPASLAIALGLLEKDVETKQPEIRLFAETSDATPTDMLVAGKGVKYLIPENHVGVFNGRVWGQVNGTHAVTAWNISGCILNRDGLTSIAGSAVVTAITTVQSGWAIDVTGDNLVDGLNVEVTGAASTDIVWRASIDLNLDPFPS